MKRREASCKLGAVTPSEPSETGEDVQGCPWRLQCQICSLELEVVDKAEVSVDTMQGIQETMHSTEDSETRDEGVQCMPNKLEVMEVDEGTVENTLAVV